MSHYHQNHNYNNNRHNNNNNRHNNKGNTVEIHCKNVPSRVQRKQWFQFVNKQTNNKKWIKNIKSNHEWIIIVKNQEKDEWRNALSGKNISQNKITVYIKGGGGRNNNRYNNRRQSAFNDNNKNFRGNNKGNNNKYSKLFTKHLSNKQQQDMLNLCGKRYNSENKMLDLNGIISKDQEHWASFSNEPFITHLLNIIKNNCSDMTSINLANNNIQTLEGFRKLNQYAPYLENLSLLDNPIKCFSEINYLNSLSLNLREFHLRNLGLLNEVKGFKQLYINEICKRFPNLRLLDGEPITNINLNLISFGTAIDQSMCQLNSGRNLPVNPHETCMNQSSILDFVNNYYKLFDVNTNNSSERRKLVNLYHGDAVFTLTYTPNKDIPNTISPMENKSNNWKDANKSCNQINRNLIDGIYKLQPRWKQLNKVKHGNLDIIKYLNDEFIQKTKHQISYMSIDCHPIKIQNKDFMQVLINGYFAENKDVARKFNRTWLLMQENTGIIIANDQLHLGGVIPQSKLLNHAPASSIADLNKQNKKGNQINSGSSGDISISMNSGNNPNQQNLINAVAKRCGCPIEMSKQALEASNWDPNVAVTKIETFRRSKPPQ